MGFWRGTVVGAEPDAARAQFVEKNAAEADQAER
jgi:hypothetical protein